MESKSATTARLVLGIVSGAGFTLFGALAALGILWAISGMDNPGPLVWFPPLFILMALVGIVIVIMSIVIMVRTSAKNAPPRAE